MRKIVLFFLLLNLFKTGFSQIETDSAYCSYRANYGCWTGRDFYNYSLILNKDSSCIYRFENNLRKELNFNLFGIWNFNNDTLTVSFQFEENFKIKSTVNNSSFSCINYKEEFLKKYIKNHKKIFSIKTMILKFDDIENTLYIIKSNLESNLSFDRIIKQKLYYGKCLY